MKGKVLWWNDSKGFGYIRGEDDRDYLAHFTDITGEGFKELVADEEVTFEPGRARSGIVANVIVRQQDQNRPVVIKDCPCCSSKANSKYDYISGDQGHMAYRVRCTRCTINSGWYDDEATAIKIWNKRP